MLEIFVDILFVVAFSCGNGDRDAFPAKFSTRRPCRPQIIGIGIIINGGNVLRSQRRLDDASSSCFGLHHHATLHLGKGVETNNGLHSISERSRDSRIAIDAEI